MYTEQKNGEVISSFVVNLGIFMNQGALSDYRPTVLSLKSLFAHIKEKHPQATDIIATVFLNFSTSYSVALLRVEKSQDSLNSIVYYAGSESVDFENTKKELNDLSEALGIKKKTFSLLRRESPCALSSLHPATAGLLSSWFLGKRIVNDKNKEKELTNAELNESCKFIQEHNLLIKKKSFVADFKLVKNLYEKLCKEFADIQAIIFSLPKADNLTTFSNYFFDRSDSAADPFDVPFFKQGKTLEGDVKIGRKNIEIMKQMKKMIEFIQDLNKQPPQRWQKAIQFFNELYNMNEKLEKLKYEKHLLAL